jgi:pimeloyl-ACP methyl ester carboxylesterase
LLPQGEHVICRGAGDIPHVTHPDEYVRHVLALLLTSEQVG